MIGDGFGGRKWYSPTNYSVGSYAAYSVCYDDCYTTSENQLFGWGSNFRNTLGLGPTVTDTIYPTPIPFMGDVQYFSAGYVMGVIKRDSTGWAWGQSVMTQTGILGSPIQVITDVKFLDAGSSSISFVKYDGTVWQIGDNSYGNFGIGSITPPPFTTIPVQTLNINTAVRTASNRYNTIILLEDSTVWSVGSNSRGGLGVPFVNTSYIPIQIPTLSNIIDIKSAASSTIALDSAGNVYAWGEVMPNWGTFIYVPQLVLGLNDIVAISACDDGFHYFALDENKNCYVWGENSWGQCGFPSSTPTIQSPQLVATDVIDIMAGETFSYIVKSNGNLLVAGLGNVMLNLYPINEVDSFTIIDPSQVPQACRIIGSGLLCDSTNFIEEPITINDSIYFPNVFTPNGDNSNDNFYFPNWGVEQLKCEIYNRWGTLIYQWNEIDGFWDGRTSSGEKCSDGVYYYIVHYKKLTSENWEKHTGYVSLLR